MKTTFAPIEPSCARSVRAVILVAAALISNPATADPPALDEDIPSRGIWSARPAPRWEEGLLIGNGRMGAVIHGKTGDWTLSLTHEQVVIPDHVPAPPPELSKFLPEIRSIIRGGERWKAASLAWNKTREMTGVKDMIWTDPFVIAAGLGITVNGAASPKALRRSLDYATGLARIQWTDAGTRYEQRSFMSRADNALVLQINADGEHKLSGSIQLRQGDHGLGKRLENARQPVAEGEWMSARFGYTLNDGGYEVLARVVTDGARTAAADTITIKDARSITVFLRIQPLADYDASQIDSTRTEFRGFSGADFDSLLARHVALHGELYERVRIDLGGDPAEREMPAEMLWEKTHKKDATPALLERVFDAGRYHILSSTGNWPPNLQGIWAGGRGIPWRGDFTQNGNVPSAIGNMLNGNMPELLLAYTGYLESLMDHHRANAKQLYGARGIMLSSRTHIDGYAQHYNHHYPHAFWVAGAAWAAGFFHDYYLYTGDREFLENHALPWMKEAALFFEDFLVEDENGTYEFIPGYSPETGGAAMNTTMDVAAARQLLRNLIGTCSQLGIGQENVTRWKEMLTKMPDYRIADGRLAEWIDPRMRDNLGHRHCSHFLPLWFGLDPAIANNPELLAAAHKAVRDKAGVRCKDKGSAIMSFGTAQLGWAAASLGDAQTVDKVLDYLATVHYYPTFASAHDAKPDGPQKLNADIAGAVPSLMIEMLVQSQPGEIKLLGALPESLPKGSIEGALCRGAITIEKLTWSPEAVTVRLRSAKKQEINLTLMRGAAPQTVSLTLPAGEVVEKVFR